MEASAAKQAALRFFARLRQDQNHTLRNVSLWIG